MYNIPAKRGKPNNIKPRSIMARYDENGEITPYNWKKGAKKGEISRKTLEQKFGSTFAWYRYTLYQWDVRLC